MRRITIPFLLSVVLVAAGCVPPSITPSHAAADWVRLESQHFDLSTDLALEDAQRAVVALEQNRAALLLAGWGKDSDDRITSRAVVVVLRSRLQFEHYGARRFQGLYSGSPRPTIFLAGPPEVWEQGTEVDGTTSVLRHELVHQLAAGFYGRQPRWFSEGLAQFLETLTISADGSTTVLGRPNLVALRSYRTMRDVRVRDVLDWKADTASLSVGGLYGMSWLLVHWLVNTQPEGFAAFQLALRKGVEPSEAWSASFPGLAGKDLDQELQHYARFGKFAEVPGRLPAIKVEQARKALTDADVRSTLALLAWGASALRGEPALRREARQEIDGALALEPGNALALNLWRRDSEVPVGDAVARLRRQVGGRPDDGEAWLMLGELLGDEAAVEREAALRRAVVLMPRNSRALNNLAWMLVGAQRGAEALPFAAKAVMLSPWDSAVADTHAATLFALGRCRDALSTERRALELVDETATAETLRPYTTKIREYEQACGAPVAAP